MSDIGILVPIAMFTIGPICWAANNWVRARHGYEPERWRSRRERRQGAADAAAAEGTVRQLAQENERQRTELAALRERLQVLERIATDPATRVAAEIDALR